MIILSLIIVVVLERLIKPSSAWHFKSYFDYYYQHSKGWWNKFEQLSAELQLLLWLAVPCLIVVYLQSLFGDTFSGLLFSSFILFLCFGCPAQRAAYKAYLQAACRQDENACQAYAEAIGAGEGRPCQSVSQNLIWVNFVHYFAVMFWFVVFGPAGAVLYVFCRQLHKQNQLDSENHAQTAEGRLIYILDWLPARLSGLAFLFVGHFTRALPVWLSEVFSLTDTKEYLIRIATAAEEYQAPAGDYLSEPCRYVKLAKRAFLFMLSIAAMLSLMGVI